MLKANKHNTVREWLVTLATKCLTATVHGSLMQPAERRMRLSRLAEEIDKALRHRHALSSRLKTLQLKVNVTHAALDACKTLRPMQLYHAICISRIDVAHSKAQRTLFCSLLQVDCQTNSRRGF